MKYLALCSYDGTKYYGWQKQPDEEQVTISQEIEKVLSQILDEKIIIHGSGRTDRYVHAIKQSFHFESKKRIKDINKTLHSINALLPKDIHLKYLGEVNDNFHARYDVKSKTYIYRIFNQNYDPFQVNYGLMLNQKLNLKKMKKAARLFEGKHSFINFTTKEEDEKDFVRIIRSATVKKVNPFEIWISFRGNGFMRYQVRFMVGSLIQVGLEKIEEDYIKKLLQDTNRRDICKYKAEPQALYLFDIKY